MEFGLENRSTSEGPMFTLRLRLNGDDGQDLIEYALLTAVLSVGCILSIQAVLGGVMPFFDRILAAFTSL